jgi:hypothetical protein
LVDSGDEKWASWGDFRKAPIDLSGVDFIEVIPAKCRFGSICESRMETTKSSRSCVKKVPFAETKEPARLISGGETGMAGWLPAAAEPCMSWADYAYW